MTREDRSFLKWIYNRLHTVHKENPNLDYMRKLKSMTVESRKDQLSTLQKVINIPEELYVQPDVLLARIVGNKPLPRMAIVRLVWKYIQEKGLYKDRTVFADELLGPLFGKNSATLFQLAQIIQSHCENIS